MKVTVSMNEREQSKARLAILRLLTESTGYEQNDAIIGAAVARDLGHAMTRDEVRREFAWLESEGLIRLKKYARAELADLMLRGMEIASGSGTVPGIMCARPDAL